MNDKNGRFDAGADFLHHSGHSSDLDATVQVARRKQRRRRTLIAIAGTVVGVVVTIVAVQTTGSSGNDRPAAGPVLPQSPTPAVRHTTPPTTPPPSRATPPATNQSPPPTLKSEGKTLTYVGEEVWSQPAIDESHPNSVIVYASVAGGQARWGPYCTMGTTAIGRVTRETARSLTVSVSKYAIRPGKPGECLDVGRAPIPVTVPLPEAIGDRQLIDATGHVARVVLDPRTVLRPNELPPGYTGGQATWANKSDTEAQRYYHSRRGDLVITVGPASLNKPMRQVLKHTTVRGHPATVSFDPGFAYDLRIAWSEDRTHAVTLYQISSYKDSQGLGLTADQLINIANSLR